MPGHGSGEPSKQKNRRLRIYLAKRKFHSHHAGTSSIVLAYGTDPRLLLTWLATEAVKTRERELFYGDTLSSFMRERG